MEAIVLAGGFGTRLKGVVSDVPKPMAPIGERPFLEILLSQLAENGFTRVVLAVGYLSNIIIDHFGNAFKGMDIDYVVEDAPLGTGGAVKFAMTKIHSDHVYVFNGDTFLDLEVSEVETLWNKTSQQIMIARHVPDTARYGRLEIKEGRVSGFKEKGQSGAGLINAGCYVLFRDALSGFEAGMPFSLEADYFETCYTATPIRIFETRGHFIDIGIPSDFARAQSELAAY